jgi:hypothetical protein
LTVRDGIVAVCGRSPKGTKPSVSFPLETLSSLPADSNALDSIGRLTDDLVVQRRDRRRQPMELFTKLFGTWLVFVYHCFDRIVLSGYLMGLQRPGQVVFWLQHVLGVEAVTKELLSHRTQDYISWVESFARNRKIPVEWAEKDTRKEDYVQPFLRRMERAGCYGVYFIFQAMEQGWTFRPGRQLVKRNAPEADYPILHKHRARYRYFYFYLRDEVLGPMVLRMGTFIPFEASYYLNGHSYIEQELNRRQVSFRKDDKCAQHRKSVDS